MNSSKLTFNKPAIHFEEAFPIGNGLMGAMVYGGFNEDTLSLTHTHLWSGEPHSHENPKAKEAYLKARDLAKESGLCEAQRLLEKEHSSNWSESFLALGDLRIKLPGSTRANYSRALDLSSGLVNVIHGGTPPKGVRHSYFASYPAKAIAIRYSLEKKNDFEVYFNPKIRSRLSFEKGILIARGRCPYLQHPHYYVHHNEKNSYYAPDRGIPFTLAIKPVTDGRLIDNGYCFFVEDASFLELYVSCFTGFKAFDTLPEKEHEAPCLKAVEDAAKKGFDRLFEEHLEDFSSLYSRVSLELEGKDGSNESFFSDSPDYPALTKLLFDFGRYLMICSSRKESSAINLQGLFNKDSFAPWCANYTVNINTEMNYWPAGICDLLPCAESLGTLVESISRHGEKTALDFYGAPGFVCHHNSDLWAHTEPVGAGEDGCAIFSFWPMGSGWLVCQLYDLYQYSPNPEKLKKLYPIILGATKFYKHLLTDDGDGKLVFSPSTSPENSFTMPDGQNNSVSKWSAMTQQIIKKLFGICVACQKELNVDRELEKELSTLLPLIKLSDIADDGTLIEWDSDYTQKDPLHRHVSHLWGLFPGDLFGEDETLRRACQKTLKKRGDLGTGWSLGWKVNLYAYLGQGDKAFEILKNQLSIVEPSAPMDMHKGGSYPNLLCAHPPFQIDGNFGATSGIASMFLQSGEDYIKILPALPEKLGKGRIRGLLAKGGIKTDISFSDGKLSSFSLVSPRDRKVKLCFEGKSLKVDLKKNETFTYKEEV